MKQIDEIYQYILKKELRQSANGERQEELGVTATEIEEYFHIVRNNASTMLNRLTAEKKLIKLPGRPVRFITFQKGLLLEKETAGQPDETAEKSLQGEDPFGRLIGWQGSLSSCIIQAKAAMIYPPNGLHTLIFGKSGVGKSLFAHTMYQYAKWMRSKREEEFPFIAFNCADYYNNSQLLYAHLFGHVKGAFTGAGDTKPGLVEAANGGILFLDEVHRLPPNGQEMLFTLIDKGEFFRLGESEKPRKSNVLIIAATTEEPSKTLLATFLRRISVMISLPSIGQRGEEERMELIRYLFDGEAKKTGLSITVSDEVMRKLLRYPCPGNVGQLKSDICQICSKAFLQKEREETSLDIQAACLPQHIQTYAGEQAGSGKREEAPGKKQIILVICSSGAGSGRIFLEAVKKLLAEYDVDMEAAVLPYQDVVRKSPAYEKLVSQYTIIAGIGNMTLDWELPYFDMAEVLSNRKDNALKTFLSSYGEKKGDEFEQAYKLLEETTLAVNPKQAIKHIRTFMERSCSSLEGIQKNAVIKCAAHIGYMLERLLTRQYIRHDYKEQLMEEYGDLIVRLRENASVFNEIYHIEITDDELCFLADLMVKLEMCKGGEEDGKMSRSGIDTWL